MINFNIEHGNKTPFKKNEATFIANDDEKEQIQVFKHLRLPVTIFGVYKEQGPNANQLFISDSTNKILFENSRLTVGYGGHGVHNFQDALNNIPGIEGNTDFLFKTHYDEKGLNYNDPRSSMYSIEIHVL